MNHAKGFDSLFIVFVTALSGFQSGLLSRQIHVTPMVQDAENECRVFETFEVTTAEKQGKETRKNMSLRSKKKPLAQTVKPKHPAAAAQREAARVCQFTFAVALQMVCL